MYMKSKFVSHGNTAWLNPYHALRVKEVFEKKYKKRLSDEEVTEIAKNLVGMMEIIFRINVYEKCI